VSKGCPDCQHYSTVCKDSRPTSYHGYPATRRRRECKKCKHRFSTIEVSDIDLAAIQPPDTELLNKQVTLLIEKHLRGHAQTMTIAVIEALRQPNFFTQTHQGSISKTAPLLKGTL
jgi:hypothetical protein